MKTPQLLSKSILVLGICGLALQGCRDNSKPGIEYANQMVHSIPLEPYTQTQDSTSPFKDGMNAQFAPEGTVAQGGVLNYSLKQNDSDWALAANIKAPFPSSADVLKEGKVLYERYCSACHGKTGKGDGTIPAKKTEIAPPQFTSERLKAMNEGQIYHTIMVGRNAMGSHASQMNVDERWKVVHYVRSLQGPTMTAAPVDSAVVVDASKPEAKAQGHK